MIDFDKYTEENYTSVFRRYIALGFDRPRSDTLTMRILLNEWYREYHNGGKRNAYTR